MAEDKQKYLAVHITDELVRAPIISSTTSALENDGIGQRMRQNAVRDSQTIVNNNGFIGPKIQRGVRSGRHSLTRFGHAVSKRTETLAASIALNFEEEMQVDKDLLTANKSFRMTTVDSKNCCARENHKGEKRAHRVALHACISTKCISSGISCRGLTVIIVGLPVKQ